jgi:hypothetical protein
MAQYDVFKKVMLFKFDKPIQAHLTVPDMIAVELGDSGGADFTIPGDLGLAGQPDPMGDPTIALLDLNKAFVFTKNLAIAAMSGKKMDILAEKGAFTDVFGAPNREVVGADNIRLRVVGEGFVLGVPGDASANGEVSALDAALILKYAVAGDPQEIPAYDAIQKANQLLADLGEDADLLNQMLDISGDGNVSAYDSALALQASVGVDISSLAPPAGSLKRSALRINSYEAQELVVSIDLDSVSDVYSADMVMTYDPQVLTVVDVSRTFSTSGWLAEDVTDPGKLRVALAGAQPPVEDGSIITVRFHAASEDAISRLNIAELTLNDGIMKTAIENLPEAFVLLQNYPNPFNPETWIPYKLSRPADVSIAIYSVSGQMIRRLELGKQMPGQYVDRPNAAYWDGKNEFGEEVSSGIYFYQLQAGSDVSVKKMIVVR